MQINYTGEAFESMLAVVNYIESKNTLGAGVRWLNKLESFLNQSLVNADLTQLCNNRTFYELKLRCLNFNDWVIAFSIDGNKILI